MKIHNIDKKDLLLIEEKEKEMIEVTAVLVDDIEDDTLTLILCLGDEDNPVDIKALNIATFSMAYLLSQNPQLQSIPAKIVITMPENLPTHYPNAQPYSWDRIPWEKFIDEIDNDLDLLEENWFFISVGESISQEDITAMVEELNDRYGNMNCLIMRPKIQVFYE